MSPIASLMEAPADLRVAEVCRRLPAGMIAGFDADRPPADGDLCLARIAGAEVALELSNGRAARLYRDDHALVVAGTYVAPLEMDCQCPQQLGVAGLVSRAGIAGLPTRRSREDLEADPVSLLGVAVDAGGAPVNLRRLAVDGQARQRPVVSVAVVSAARASRAAHTAAALVRGFRRMGLSPGTAKPIGMIVGSERWLFMDAGAVAALDIADTGRLCAAGLDAAALHEIALRQLHALADARADVAVLRVGGGLGAPEVRALLGHDAFAGLGDGVVLAAADALSAIEAVAQLRDLGLPVLAVSGAIARSPLAAREAVDGLDVPVLSPDELANPATLQRLLSEARRGPSELDAAPPRLAA